MFSFFKTIVIAFAAILLLSNLIESAPAYYSYPGYGSNYITNSGVPYSAISGNYPGSSSWDNSIMSHILFK
uniref:Uncharacterized protein n=1 Tax=Panagrolaimus davidi TaxID=227884 RepID=A0A914QDJ9_9BILA